MHERSAPGTLKSRLACRMMWWIYNLGLLLGMLVGLPILIPLVLTSRKWRPTFCRRLGWWRHANADRGPAIWVHALSVGEVTASEPLVQCLAKRYAGHRIVLTASTLTGFETARRIYGGREIELAYFPYDLIFSVRAVARKIDPKLVILVETDIWPNFMAEIKRRKVPLWLANFRLSDRAWRKYRAFRGLARLLFGAFETIFLQNEDDATKLRGLGIGPQRLRVTGNLKFDVTERRTTRELDGHWRQKLKIACRVPVIVAGSTHEGDEAFLMEAFRSLRPAVEDLKLIIVPRDPRRSPSIVALCREFAASCSQLSSLQADAWPGCPDVVVVDTIGLLKELYGLASVAFVGGSLSSQGGHNPLEPAARGKPILFGPDMRDFQRIAASLTQAQAACQVSDPQQLSSVLLRLLKEPGAAESMGNRALAVFQEGQGAAARIVDHLEI